MADPYPGCPIAVGIESEKVRGCWRMQTNWCARQRLGGRGRAKNAAVQVKRLYRADLALSALVRLAA